MRVRICLLTTLLTLSSTLILARGLDTQLPTGICVALGNQVVPVDPQLQLETEIIKQTYCDGPDPDLLTKRLLLRLIFRNLGSKTIILQRGSNQVSLLRINKTLADAMAGKSEKTVNNYIITANEHRGALSTKQPLDGFLVLKSGDTYGTIADVSIAVPRLAHVDAGVDPGSHYLQIAVWTWDQSQAKAEAMRKKWHAKGMLWSETILSTPMPFTVLPQPKPEDCRCDNSKVNRSGALAIAQKQMTSSKVQASLFRSTAFAQGCEWHVILTPRHKGHRTSRRYVIDKNTGIVLAESQD